VYSSGISLCGYPHIEGMNTSLAIIAAKVAGILSRFPQSISPLFGNGAARFGLYHVAALEYVAWH